jgi:hypothetical protein
MAQFPSTTSAYGIWALKEQRDAVRGSNWPTAFLMLNILSSLVVAVGGLTGQAVAARAAFNRGQ